MALTASGQLSLGDIATEMGVLFLSNVSLTTQSTTGINTNSSSYPDGSTPHAVSEFYSYDHLAIGTTYNEWTGDGPHPGSDEACEVEEPATSFYHDGSGGDPTTGDTVYTDSSGNNTADAGYYRTGCCYIQVDDSGVVTDDVGECGR